MAYTYTYDEYLLMNNPLFVPVRNRSRGCSPSSPWGHFFPAVFAVTALFVLSACAETRHDISKALGLEKPDFNEEEVLTGEPLAIPPNFDLRPPGSVEGLYYPSADSGAPGAVAPQPQAIPVLQQPAQATQAYGRANTGGYAATPSGAYNYDAQPVYAQPYPQPYGGQAVYSQQPYAQQPEAQNMSGYQGQAQALPPAASPAATPTEASEFSECDEVIVDYSGKYICVE